MSIPSNIAEGAEQDSVAEFDRFLHIAKGSAAELRTQVYIASQIEMIPDSSEKEWVAELKTISSMLHSLIQTIRKKPQPRS